jgi:hypothetical protein
LPTLVRRGSTRREMTFDGISTRSMGAYRLGTAEANNKPWDGEIPIADKNQYRDPAVQEAFNNAARLVIGGQGSAATLRSSV